MKIERIHIFKNSYTQYDVLHHFRASLGAALERKGIEITLIENSLPHFYKNPPDYTLAFNGLLPSSKGEFLSDELQIPHVAWMVDSAHFFKPMTKSKFNVLITPDLTSSDLMTMWGAEHSFFLPHAFEKSLLTPPDQERKIPIAFTGSLIDPKEIEENWSCTLPKALVSELLQKAHEVLHSKDLTYQKAFQDIEEKIDPENRDSLILSFERLIRGQDRIELLKALKGLPVHIYGSLLSKRSWGDFLDIKGGNYTIHPPISFQETINVIKNTKILLNSSPMFKTGAHERIFYGLGLGAAVLTTDTSWIQSHFDVPKELLVYKLGQENPKEAIKHLLENPTELIEMVLLGQNKVMHEHTWDNRATSLVTILENEYDKFLTE